MYISGICSSTIFDTVGYMLAVLRMSGRWLLVLEAVVVLLLAGALLVVLGVVLELVLALVP